jgi:hypothetical protein
MVTMKAVACTLTCAGAVLALASLVFRFPTNNAVNGYAFDAFELAAVLGLVVVVSGVVLIRRAR